MIQSNEFNPNSPIYRQIAEAACQRILGGEWRDGERIPSVRELSLEMGVNTRTVLKAMEFLQDRGIIYPKRGMGFYAADDAQDQVYRMRREEFFENVLPSLWQQMESLKITPEELTDYIRKFSNR